MKAVTPHTVAKMAATKSVPAILLGVAHCELKADG